MPKQTLTIDNLGDLDGGAARQVINAALASAVYDLDDRGGEDEKPRKVVITISLDKLDNGAITAQVEAIAKVPNYKTGTTICNLAVGPRNQRTLEFRGDSPNNPDQTTIDDHLHQGEE